MLFGLVNGTGISYLYPSLLLISFPPTHHQQCMFFFGSMCVCVCVFTSVCVCSGVCMCVCVYNYVHMCSAVCVNMKNARICRLLKVLQALTKWDNINSLLLLSVIIIHQRYYLFGMQVLLVCMQTMFCLCVWTEFLGVAWVQLDLQFYCSHGGRSFGNSQHTA